MSRHGGSRITCCHGYVRKVLGQVLSLLGDANLNVVDMVNKSRGEIAYNIIDLEGEVDEAVRERVANVDGVMRVRLI